MLKRLDESDGGFTLVEVIAALTILSLALVALFGTFSEGFFSQRRARDLAEATSLAQSVLARVGTELPLREGGVSEVTEAGYRWTLTVAPYRGTAGQRGVPVAPYEVTVAVHAPSAIAAPTISLSTIRLVAGSAQ